MKLHHIGIAVTNITNSTKFYIEQGYKADEIVFDAIQNVYICFLEKDGSKIELLEPVNEESPVYNTISRNGGGIPYHICYEVESIGDERKKLKKFGFIPVTKINKAVAINDGKSNVCFFYSNDNGLIELVEIL